jgi:HlyD family secretion protein
MAQIDKKKIYLAVIIFASILLLYYISRGCGEKSNFTYKYGKPTMGEINKTISVTGKLEVIDAERVLSKVAGIIQKVYFDYNDNVKKGQVMMRIDSPKVDEGIIKYRDTIESLKIKIHAAERKLEASKKMLEEKLVPKENVRTAEMELRSLKVSMKHTNMSFSNLMEQKRATNMRAPVSGVILSRHIEENVNVGNGSLAFVIAPDLKKMRLIISIDEADIGGVKNGQKVTFSVSAFPNKTFEGRVKQVRMEPKKSGGIVTYDALVDCSNEELLLKPGMTATASVLIARKENVLRILNQSFLVTPKKTSYPPGKKFVWIRDRISLDPVPMNMKELKTGLVGDKYTEILDKLPMDAEILIRIDEKDK